jgi:AraC family transcriptional regulator
MAITRKRSPSLPAIEAFRRAIHVPPTALREADGGATVSVWSTGPLGEYEISPMREPMIALHTGGVARFQTRIGDRWTEPCPPGQVFWIPADFRTIWRINGRLEFIGVHFGASALERIARETGIPSAELARLPFRPGFHDAFASSACATLADEAARAGPGARTRFAEILAETLGVYLAQHASQPPDTSSLVQPVAPDLRERAIDRIEASIASGISVDDLARSVAMSPSAFARAFKRAVGVSPHQYLIARRIEIAKHLLERTHFSIAEIAQETGFSSQAHFTNQFREHVAMTPRQYRRDIERVT